MLNQLLYQVLLECKELVKYLGILIDKNLSWKQHIDLIALIEKLWKLVKLYESSLD